MIRKVIVLILILALGSLCAMAAAKPAAAKSEECLACHSSLDSTATVNGKQVSIQVKEDAWKASIHGSMFQCIDCHDNIKMEGGAHAPFEPKVDCAKCHTQEVQAYKQGHHSIALEKGNANSATCLSCHGDIHEVLPSSDPKSKVNHANIPATCGSCHGNAQVMGRTELSVGPFKSYEESVHGKLVANGKDANSGKAAVCTDCHGAHDILEANDSKSPIFKFNVPQTCAKCHENVKAQYSGSIHGQSIARGNWQAPVCTDCHGIHLIKRPSDPTSPVNGTQVAQQTCAKCHESMRMASEFDMAGRRATTYLSSYHGLATQGGSKVAANCASCHGVHNILPSSDPKSTVNKANLAKTCGTCHPGASGKFLDGKVHVDVPLSADIGSKAVRFVRRFYLLMILFTIGGMGLHNFIIWRRKTVMRRNAQRRIVQRMTNRQRYQHLALLSSFFALVITGFALKYPDTWYAHMFGLPETIRGWVHRGAAVVMIIAGLYHAVYLVATAEGRKMIKDMLPTPKDLFDVIGTMKFYLGLSSEKPDLPRFSYAEKAEYLALIWGTFVMAATGSALWFKVYMGHVAPRWTLDVATAVHFYEAILATLAIIVWHFYWIMFDPDVYPLNWAWYDGKMDVELYHHEHGADHETIHAAIEQAAEANDKADAATTKQ